MKPVLAGRKVEKAIDAMIELQQDYNEEMLAAGAEGEVQYILDNLNRISNKIDSL